MDKNFKNQSISSVRWTLIDRGGSQLMLLVNILILGRLLSPKDYGMVGMLYIFMTIAGLFIDSGMGAGLIRKQDVTKTDSTTIFYFNIGVSIFFYLVIYLIAPYVSLFYKEPLLTNLLRVLGLNMIITSFGQVHAVLLRKELKVRKVTRANLIGLFIATVVGVICAYNGLGVWSLIIPNLLQSVIAVILLWNFSSWRPGFEFSIKSLKEFYAFGLGLLMSSIVEQIFNNIYQPFIGKMFSASYTGFYYQAKRLNEVPISTLSSVVNSVTFPILVKYQDNIGQLKTTYEKIIKLLIFVTLPVVILINVLARSIVFILMGEKWLFAADLLQILSLAGIFMVLENINRNLLKVEGKTTLIFKLELVKKSIVILTILATYKFGIEALMYGIVFNSIISFTLNQYFTVIRITDYKKILIILLNGVFMAIPTVIVAHFFTNYYISLFLGAFAGLTTYMLIGYVLKIQEQRWAFSILSNKFK
ncbi:MAG: lipopolysaccharide biosynthesis protein [Sphingobacteriales bacterium]|nr:lipopolysaccharide biosynthesis protein [Sphingobacteriales bacterium]